MYSILLNRIKAHKRLAVAFSGGVDSALVLFAARDSLGADNVYALTFDTPMHPARDAGEAREFAQTLGVRHEVVHIDPLDCPEVVRNLPDRCYHCKRFLFERMRTLAEGQGFHVLADGTNADDINVYRPGLRAVAELGVASPLRDAGLSKADVRVLASELGLVQKSKPAAPCFATRVPYGEPLEHKALRTIEAAERAVLARGLSDCRVRHHGLLARIEVPYAERGLLLEADGLTSELKMLGYEFITIDLEGYRMGCYDQPEGEDSP